MSNLGQTFNQGEAPADDGFSAIPAGQYQVNIGEATLNDTKAGTGQYIKLKLVITGPKYQGRVLFANLNIRNQSETAERIGHQQLDSVMRAIGLASVQDTDQLIGGDMVVKVSKIKDEEFGDDEGFKNEVKGYKAINGSAPPAPQQPTTQQQAEAPANGGSKPPWANK